MSSEPQGQKEKKKGRKRVKAIHAKIKEQMEFYFSDSNLHKDRFLKKAIDATTDGYIELSTFLKFNRIRALTEEVKVIADAIAYKSELLQINEDRTKVKRIKPLSELKDVDQRTVYVEYLPNTADHEWVKKLFSVCGKVSYVSLPKYHTTGDLKGFGFVEFETEEAAKRACQELNNPPVEAAPKIGMFPKSSKPLDALKKKLPEDQILETEERAKMEVQNDDGDITDIKETESQEIKETQKTEETSEITGGILVKRVKRSRTKSEGSVDNSFSDSSPQKRKKHEVSFDLPEDSDKIASGGKKKSRKRKGRSKTVDTVVASSDSDKSELNVPDKTELLKSDNSEELKGSPTKRRKDDKESGKRKLDSDDSETSPAKKKLDLDIEKDKDSDSLVGKKRKLGSNSDDTVKDVDDRSQKKRRRQSSRESSVSQSDNEAEKKVEIQSKTELEPNGGDGEVVGKKKKSRRRRKQHKQKEAPELRVIPKSEWLCLREEYLKLQKASMAMLKRTLAEMKDKNNTNVTKEGEKKKQKHEISFIPDVIVKVSSEKPMIRKTLKSDLGEGVAVAYIDLKDGLCEGHIRCKDADSAKKINSQQIEGYSFSLVTGENEKVYWDKLLADREGKHSNKSRNKKRGHEKCMEKAQKASIENMERKHIIFDED